MLPKARSSGAATLEAIVELRLLVEKDLRLVADDDQIRLPDRFVVELLTRQKAVAADEVVVAGELVPHASIEPQKVLLLQTGPQANNTIAVDLDTLARTIATAVADVFDERFPTLMRPQAVPHTAGYLTVEALSAVVEPAKPSFWRNLMHTDVVLIALTAVLSIVVLVAWMG